LEKLRDIVETTNASQADLVLLAGDYVIHGVKGGTFVGAEAIAAELARLDPRHGTYAVLGNHDWWYDANRVAQALQDEGIELLEDRNKVIEAGDCRFTLVGISDYWEGDHDVDAALDGIDARLPTIVFTHNPDIFPMIPDSVSLTVAGHTHGGQVNLPLVGRTIVPSAFGDRYAAGLVVEDDRHLFVSTGLGTSILPVRFRVPPEISVLVLEE
jgi:predicted MPP superfamily phosphohydrolase